MMEEKKSPFFYGWVIVAICFITVAISYGIRYSFSVFYGEILNEFGWSRADTALIFSLNMIVYGIGAPLSGWAVDRFGPRKFMTAAVVVLALGTGLSALTTQVWHLYLTFGVLASLRYRRYRLCHQHRHDFPLVLLPPGPGRWASMAPASASLTPYPQVSNTRSLTSAGSGLTSSWASWRCCWCPSSPSSKGSIQGEGPLA